MDAPPHYCLTAETKTLSCGRQLVRIQALVDLPLHGVKAGDLGGWVECVENLQENAWVGHESMVYGAARVYGDAGVYGRSQVYGNAQVYGYALVFRDTQVYDNAQVYGHACLQGNLYIFDNAHVYGHAKVLDNSSVYGQAQVFGNAKVRGSSEIYGQAQVFGYCSVLGKTSLCGDAEVEHTKDYLTLGPLGANRFITLTQSDQCVTAGCFRGTVAEFAERVARDYPDGSDYARALPFIQSWLNPQPDPVKKTLRTLCVLPVLALLLSGCNKLDNPYTYRVQLSDGTITFLHTAYPMNPGERFRASTTGTFFYEHAQGGTTGTILTKVTTQTND